GSARIHLRGGQRRSCPWTGTQRCGPPRPPRGLPPPWRRRRAPAPPGPRGSADSRRQTAQCPWIRWPPGWPVALPRPGSARRPAPLPARSRGAAPVLLEIRLDELLEIAVHDTLYVGHLHLGAVIVHHRIGLEYVGPDLVAPGIVGLGGLDQRARGLLLLELPLIDRSAQHLHGRRAILGLAPLRPAGHDGARPERRAADRGRGPGA